jgi:SAM-dependent methyltransferase
MPSLGLTRTHALEAFEAFAPYYDRFTAHHDYDAWLEVLVDLATANGLRGRRALDIACGTGKSVLPLLAKGFEVTACDQSPAMLAKARAKTGDHARLHLLDVRELPVLGRFDLVTALCDIVNYLVDPEELVAMFRGVRANLASGGIFVFDANTLWIYDNFWAAHPSAEAEGTTISWECLVGPGLDPGGLAMARVHVAKATDHYASVHYERHHPRCVVEQALKSAGLEAVAVHGQFPDGRLEPVLVEERHSKAIYVVRRGPSVTERR